MSARLIGICLPASADAMSRGNLCAATDPRQTCRWIYTPLPLFRQRSRPSTIPCRMPSSSHTAGFAAFASRSFRYGKDEALLRGDRCTHLRDRNLNKRHTTPQRFGPQVPIFGRFSEQAQAPKHRSCHARGRLAEVRDHQRGVAGALGGSADPLRAAPLGSAYPVGGSAEPLGGSADPCGRLVGSPEPLGGSADLLGCSADPLRTAGAAPRTPLSGSTDLLGCSADPPGGSEDPLGGSDGSPPITTVSGVSRSKLTSILTTLLGAFRRCLYICVQGRPRPLRPQVRICAMHILGGGSGHLWHGFCRETAQPLIPMAPKRLWRSGLLMWLVIREYPINICRIAAMISRPCHAPKRWKWSFLLPCGEHGFLTSWPWRSRRSQVQRCYCCPLRTPRRPR